MTMILIMIMVTIMVIIRVKSTNTQLLKKRSLTVTRDRLLQVDDQTLRGLAILKSFIIVLVFDESK